MSLHKIILNLANKISALHVLDYLKDRAAGVIAVSLRPFWPEFRMWNRKSSTGYSSIVCYRLKSTTPHRHYVSV